jgi:N-acetyltransferase
MYTNFFKEEILLENNRARLEPLKEEHFQHLLPIALQQNLWKFVPSQIKNEADFRKYFDTALAEKNNDVAYPFAIYDKLNNCYAGCTRYGGISFANKRLEIGWTWYSTPLQKTGINKATKFLLLSYGFDVLHLNRIELKTSLLNLPSQGAMLKIGAVKEGIFRHHVINEDGTIRDSVYFSFIKPDWQNIKETIFKEFL